MDKVSRAIALLFSVAVFLGPSLSYGAADIDEEGKAMVERSNQRCDDFYRYRREMEEADTRREKDAQAIKKVRAEHDKEMELAREQYVKNRKKMIPDPRLEKEHDEQELAWKERLKIAGKHYAQRKAAVDATARRGCRVPPMLEYDLED
jgi:hypothetical protein